jgi:hypothetical protein
MKRIVLSILVITHLIFNLDGQSIPVLVTGSYDHTTLKSFIKETGQKYNVEFYYDDSSVANIMVTADFQEIPLDSCIKVVLDHSGLEYYMLNNNQVIIYSGNSLTELFGGDFKSMESSIGTEKHDVLSRDKLQEIRYQMINIGKPGTRNSGMATLSGYLRNFDTGDPVAGGNIYVSNIQKGSTSDANGFYKITLPPGNQVVNFTCIGMQPATRNINLYSDGKLDVDMELKLNLLEGAVIVGQGEGKVGKMHIGMERIEILTIKSIPTLLGESDVVKSVLILPGVVSVGEGTAGFNVRGGNTDQNLILIDRATLYYPSHFFGNFSAINSEIIQNATLYKGSIPVRYGGRISSVFEINSKDGSNERLSGSAGISPIYARFNLGGPLFSAKSTFQTSFRSTYSDWLLSRINVPELYNSEAGFYDIQARLNLSLNDKNNLLINFYHSSDRFQLHSDTSYKYRNTIGSIILNHKYNEALTGSTSLICSMFDYEISNVNSTDQSFTLTHRLTNFSLINDFVYSRGTGIRYNYGAELNFYSINPGERRVPEGSNISPLDASNEHALEYGLYGGTEYSVSGNLKIEAGIRLSGILSFDDGKKYIYGANQPYSEENIIDTLYVSNKSIQKSYMHPEWRFSLSYSPGQNSAIKFSYNKTAQYIHMISNTTAISPTDTWKLSDEYVLPETGDQVSAGYFMNFGKHRIEASGEVFYKWISNIKQYKAGADLLLNDHIETEIMNARGKAYGLELSLEKSGGRIYGRVDYTWSRTMIKSVSGFKEELINRGEYYPANWDKPHNFNMLASLKMSRRLIFSSGLYYSTGRPVTYPVSKYMLGDQVFLQYSDYNRYRLPDYFRLDLSVTYSGNLKTDKKMHSSLTFSLYNVTSRKNAYSVYYKSEGGQYRAYQLSVFGTVIPTLTYNINF